MGWPCVVVLLALLPGLAGWFSWGQSSSALRCAAADLLGSNASAPFARVEGSRDPERWRAEACPVESTAYSCYWHNYSRAWTVEHRLMPGRCRPFSVPAFEDLIRCRTLVFSGDSLALQFWQTVTCLLPHRPDAQYKMLWTNHGINNATCPFGAEHCHGEGGCAFFPDLDARLCYFCDMGLEAPLPLYVDWGLAEDSVLVVNAGAHFFNATQYAHTLRRFAALHRHAPAARRPTVLWFETLPQHFVGVPNGYWEHHRLFERCAPLSTKRPRRADWRNRVAEKVMAEAGIPVLRLWELTWSLWDFHVELNGRHAIPLPDCTHYCLYGAPLRWAVLLTDMLANLTVPKAANCSRRDRWPESPVRKFCGVASHPVANRPPHPVTTNAPPRPHTSH